MDEEVEAPPAAKRTPWPIGLHSVEEEKKREEENEGLGKARKEFNSNTKQTLL